LLKMEHPCARTGPRLSNIVKFLTIKKTPKPTNISSLIRALYLLLNIFSKSYLILIFTL
jgi:hypothetical protein